MLKRKVIKAMHKTTLDKTLEINNIINCALRQLICIVLSQVRFLFNKYIKKKMQLSCFKKTITIMLCKLRKKNYSKLLFFKFIVLLNILNKILESIISKRLCYIAKTHNTLLNIQIKAKKQCLIDTILQLITKKIYTM